MTTPRDEAEGGPPPITVTVDGVEYTVEERRQPAAAILRLAGLDPVDYDLLRVVGTGTEKPYDDDEVWTFAIFPGPEFTECPGGSRVSSSASRLLPLVAAAR